MIVAISTGSSFAGAAMYYLHDKREHGQLMRTTDDRVAWTETHNCASNQPNAAIDEMYQIAQYQNELKRESGQRPGGRPLENPVMTIALSWRPEEKPTHQHMAETAKDFLHQMGWQDHQALLLAHNDTAHQHVHIILNRVHPRTGLVHDDSNSYHRSLRWSREYDRHFGKSRADFTKLQTRQHHRDAIDARDIHHRYTEMERKGAHAIAQSEQSRLTQPNATRLHANENFAPLKTAHHDAQIKLERQALARRQQQEREAFLATAKPQFKEACQTAYRQIRDRNRPHWAEHYRQAKDSLQFASREAAQIRRQALTAARAQDFPTSHHLLARADAITNNAHQSIADARKELREAQRTETREAQDAACKQLFEQRQKAFANIKETQQQDRNELRGIQDARDANEPFDQVRLKELLSELLPAERQAPTKEEGREGAQAPVRATTPAAEKDEPTHHDRLPNTRRDGFDGLASGIGKLAEIAADMLGSLIAPPTAHEQAVEKAKAQHAAEAAPEREEDQRAAEAQKLAQTTAEKIQAYFEQEGQRIVAEEYERSLKKKREKER